MQRYENYQVEDAEYVLVAFGLPARVCRDAVDVLRARGEKAGLIRPRLVWPYPVQAFKEVNPQVKGFISIESNDLGQMVEDVALASRVTSDKRVPVYCYAHSMGTPGVKMVMEKYMEVKNGSIKEVF